MGGEGRFIDRWVSKCHTHSHTRIHTNGLSLSLSPARPAPRTSYTSVTEPDTSVSMQMTIMRKEERGRGMPRKTLATMGVASEKDPGGVFLGVGECGGLGVKLFSVHNVRFFVWWGSVVVGWGWGLFIV